MPTCNSENECALPLTGSSSNNQIMKVTKDTLVEPWFVVQRSYYSNKDAPNFKKVVPTLKGENIYPCSCGIL